MVVDVQLRDSHEKIKKLSVDICALKKQVEGLRRTIVDAQVVLCEEFDDDDFEDQLLKACRLLQKGLDDLK